jgi:hypothetical protein
MGRIDLKGATDLRERIRGGANGEAAGDAARRPEGEASMKVRSDNLSLVDWSIGEEVLTLYLCWHLFAYIPTVN